MDYKFSFLVGILAVSLALIPIGAAGEQDEEPENTFEDIPAAADDDDLFGTPGDQDEEVYYYTSEEIERNRWISLSRDGVETTETDEEVKRILDFARRDDATIRTVESYTSDEFYQEASKEKRSIIGTDDRYKTARYGLKSRTCTIGQMENGCTAFLIGPRHAITASHCVYNFTTRTWKRDLGVYMFRDCLRYGTYIDWSRAWILDIHGDSRTNMALIQLSKTFPCWLGFGYRDPMPPTHVETCGYHGDRNLIYRCTYCSNCTTELETTEILGTTITYNTRMKNTCDIYRAPGSPMVTDGAHAWGVHSHQSRTYNYAVRFSKERFYLLCNWLCITGATCSVLC